MKFMLSHHVYAFFFSSPSFPRPAGLSVLQRILDTAAERGWQVTSVNLDVLTEAAFIKLLSDLDYKREFQIIIDCELERLNYILNLVTHSHRHASVGRDKQNIRLQTVQMVKTVKMKIYPTKIKRTLQR